MGPHYTHDSAHRSALSRNAPRALSVPLTIVGILLTVGCGASGGTSLSAAQPLYADRVPDPALIAIVSAVASSSIAPERAWPGFGSRPLAFLVFLPTVGSPTREVLLVTSDKPGSSFAPIAWRAMPFSLRGRTFVPTAHAEELWGLNLHFPVGGFTVPAIPVDTDVVGSVNVVFHEAFHVYQRLRFGDTNRVSEIVDDPVIMSSAFGAFAEVERRILARALAEGSRTAVIARARQYLAVRRSRLATATPHVQDVERSLERWEGTAHLVGYQAALFTLTGRSQSAVDSVTRDLQQPLSSYPQGLGPEWRIMRWRLYATGAAMGLLLDRLGADWRLATERGAALDELLSATIGFDVTATAHLARRAIAEFGPPALP